LRRDRPQASRNHYCRTRRPILSLLIPGCSVAGDQDPSWFLVRGPMPRRCPDVSSPHLHRGEDLRCCALGKTDAGYGWLRVQLVQPGVLLLRCLGPRRAEGSGGRHVRRTGLDMLICRIADVGSPHYYAVSCISLTTGSSSNPPRRSFPGRAEPDFYHLAGICSGAALSAAGSRAGTGGFAH
jgi:hypothetical protein